ncbi:MAG: peptidoglycan DD-metalloendopeptidase family protein, partial [Actinobacteria bacterium]|nr:peptidoglycan DD-metalloendopeptidase family protein [Actinomycetota bacterium]
EQLDDHVDETSADLQQADARLEQTTGRVEAAQVALAATQDELLAAEEETERIDGELEVARANEEKIEVSLADNDAQQQESRAAVGAMARESYKNGGLGSVAMTLDVLSGDGDAVQEMAMARTVLRVQDQTLERLLSQQAQEVAEGDRLEGVRQGIALLLAQAEVNVVRKQQARDGAEQAKSELEDVLAQQAADRASLEQEKAALEQQLGAAQLESEELETELVELAQQKHGLQIAETAEQQRIAEEEARRKAEEEADRQAAEAAQEARRQRERESAERAAREREAAPEPPPVAAPEPAPTPEPAPPQVSSGFLSAPSPAAVASTFGYRVHPILGYSRLHAGIDYAGACGSPVYAPADGVVIGAPSTQAGGNKLLIDHGVHRGVNLVTTYSHLSGYAVRSGSVNRGQLVAHIGSSGLSTGCHLHFETRENGIPVDPFGWL